MTSPAQIRQIVETATRMGVFPSFTYVLATHVLHRMHVAGTRQIMLSLPDIDRTVLRGSDGRILAGQIRAIIHEGIGTPLVGSGNNHVSLHYINALQKLHWGGLILSDVMESRLNGKDYASGDCHFTMLPDTREGIHWTERTPMVYRLPSAPMQTVIDRFAGTFDETENPIYELASF